MQVTLYIEILEAPEGWAWSAWNGDKCVEESHSCFAGESDARKDARNRYGMEALSTVEISLPIPNQAMKGFSVSKAMREEL